MDNYYRDFKATPNVDDIAQGCQQVANFLHAEDMHTATKKSAGGCGHTL
jgi:hypothetical protein